MATEVKTVRASDQTQICAAGLVTRQLNERIYTWVTAHVQPVQRDDRGQPSAHAQLARVVVSHLTGQRYIGTSLAGYPVRLDLEGTPGNDLGAFLDGPTIWVHGNAQDGVGNTMNSGRIVVHGNAGDVAALSARGGQLYIWGNVGYRACLHMKEYQGKGPLVVIGGTAQDFFGEYMAGGVAVLLQLDAAVTGSEGQVTGHLPYLATGMHGGVIYIRGDWDQSVLSAQVQAEPVAAWRDEPALADALAQFQEIFADRLTPTLQFALQQGPYWRIQPRGKRPYAKLYA